MVKQIFVNLPIKDLKNTMTFWSKLGFKFNKDFTDDNATCLILGKNIYAMLLSEKFFKGFLVNQEIADAKKTKEVLTAITLGSRKAVDTMMSKALAAGAKEYRPAQDHGWMYARAFVDLDGHVWEPFYGDDRLRKKMFKKKK